MKFLARVRASPLWLIPCVAAWPVLQFLQVNAADIVDVRKLGWYVVAISGAMLLVATPIRLVGGSWSRAVLTVSLATLVFLLYGSAKAALPSPLAVDAMLDLWAVLIGVALVGGWVLFGHAAARAVAVAVLVALPVLALGTLVVNGGLATLLEPGPVVTGTDVTPGGPKPTPDLPTRTGPNVYHLVLDAYARDDQLAALGFDDTPFLEALRARGFVVPAGSYANYPVTYLSLAAVLEQQYPVLEGPRANLREHNPFLEVFRGRNRTRRFFEQQGYRYAHYQNGWWVQSMCAPPYDLCIAETSLLDEADLAFLQRTPVMDGLARFAPALRKRLVDGRRTGLGELAEALPLEGGGPWFVFAHVMSPHPPYGYSDSCGLRFDARDDLAWSRNATGLYLNEVRCLNRDLLSLVDRITRRDPDAIILLHSDHGSAFEVTANPQPLRDWTEAQMDERLGVFAAFLLPAPCRDLPYDGVSPVNFEAIIRACLSGEGRDALVEDRHFLTSFMPDDHPEHGGVVEISCADTCRELAGTTGTPPPSQEGDPPVQRHAG